MNIQLNSTFLFQIIHFWIAYCIVRFIILKPAVTLLMAKEQKNQAIREVINYTYTLIVREKEALSSQWLEGNMLHKEKMPLIEAKRVVADKDVTDKAVDKAVDKDVSLSDFDGYQGLSDEAVLELVAITTEKLTEKLAHKSTD